MPKHHETASYYIIIEELFLGCTGHEAFSQKLNICPFNHNATYLNQEMASWNTKDKDTKRSKDRDFS